MTFYHDNTIGYKNFMIKNDPYDLIRVNNVFKAKKNNKFKWKHCFNHWRQGNLGTSISQILADVNCNLVLTDVDKIKEYRTIVIKKF